MSPSEPPRAIPNNHHQQGVEPRFNLKGPVETLALIVDLCATVSDYENKPEATGFEKACGSSYY